MSSANRQYVIRRLILQAVLDCEPAPAAPSDVAGAPAIEMSALDPATIMEELRGLVAFGYVADLRPGRTPLFRLTPAGRTQIKREGDLDEYVWGEMASRFQG